MSACPLLDLKKCLGPCVRPEVTSAYREAVGQALDLLEGRNRRLLERLAVRRDALAEELRFEEAATLRDHIRTLENLLSDRQRLEAVARRNLVVVAPSVKVGCRELFFIRAGRLVDQRQVALPPDTTKLRTALTESFEPVPTGPIERELVDEMRQLDGWLYRERRVLQRIPVDPAVPTAVLPELLSAIERASEGYQQLELGLLKMAPG
jgi:DNA polymerase III subunit epsilon